MGVQQDVPRLHGGDRRQRQRRRDRRDCALPRGLDAAVARPRLNKPWNAPDGGPSEDDRFWKASALCGSEFEDALRHIVEVELPARALVEEALRGRQAVHASGEVVVFASGGCPWKTHLYELERSMGVAPLVKFVLYEDSAKMWRVQAVTEEGTAFTNRLGLLEPWRGLRDDALTAAAAIDGCKFVHASGFIGGNATRDGALAMALNHRGIPASVVMRGSSVTGQRSTPNIHMWFASVAFTLRVSVQARGRGL